MSNVRQERPTYVTLDMGYLDSDAAEMLDAGIDRNRPTAQFVNLTHDDIGWHLEVILQRHPDLSLCPVQTLTVTNGRR